MASAKNLKTLALSIILLSIILGITLTSAIAEENYKNDNNFLTDIFEGTLTENGYKTNIIVNPHTTGIYTQENGYKLDLAMNPEGIGGSHSENGYKLDLIPEKTFPVLISKLGDLNLDGIVNYKDASLFRQAYIGAYNYLADFNQDGIINYRDASLFRGYYIAG